MLCLKGRQAKLVASALLKQINSSYYTEYKAFGPSLIYNTRYTCFIDTKILDGFISEL
jgi:hypothetical protein